MLPCEHYNSHTGPKLVRVFLGTEDITENMSYVYGPDRNWQGCLWTYREAFGENSLNKQFRFDFKGEDGRDHWFNGFITNLDQYFNPPMSQLYTGINVLKE